MTRKPWTYKGCQINSERVVPAILVACNGVNRYKQDVWRITFPDGTWVRCGTKTDCRQYIGGSYDPQPSHMDSV